MGILYLYHILSIFRGVQRDYTFCMLFNGNFCIFYFFISFPCFSMETIKILILCQFSMLFNDAKVLSNTIEQRSPCVLQDIVPFGAAALLPLTPIQNHAKQGNGYR